MPAFNPFFTKEYKEFNRPTRILLMKFMVKSNTILLLSKLLYV